MSIDSAKAFLERDKRDARFRKKVGEIATKEERMEYVESAGYEFTNEEFQQAEGELSDLDLDAVAGGGHCGFTHESEQWCWMEQ